MNESLKNTAIATMHMISKCVPKKKNLWLFGAWEAKLYADNSKYLFEYVNQTHANIDAIWLTRNKLLISRIREKGYKCYHTFSFRGILLSLRAGVAFETEGNWDVSPFINHEKCAIFQLWHGMGMKSVGLQSGWFKDDMFMSEDKKRKFIKQHGEWIWLCASKEAREKYHNAFNVPYEKFYITGEPKGDTFVNVAYSQYIQELRSQNPGARIAVYLPTHRNFGHDNLTDMTSLATFKQVNDRLKEENVILIFKPHFHEFTKYESFQGKLSNVVFATDLEKYGDVYEFLPSCDMLITDYSGIMFGYLASGKPIIYFPYDMESYIKTDAGFCYKYEDILYGPVCMTWEEVICQISTISTDDYKEQREYLRNRFCPFYDGRSCERVYNKVKEIIGLKGF